MPYDRVQRAFAEIAAAIAERVRHDRLEVAMAGPEGRRLRTGAPDGAVRFAETMIVPLFSGETLIGTLKVSRGPDPFRKEDRESIRYLSRLVAAGVVGMAETALTQTRLGEADLLLRIGRATATSADPREVARIAAEFIGHLLPEPYGFTIFVLSDRMLVPLAYRVRDAILANQLEAMQFPFDKIPEERRAAFDGGRSIYAEDAVQSLTAPQARELASRFGARALLATPIRAGGEILGIIESYHPVPGHLFGDRSRRVLEGIADQLAISLHNARLARENTRRLEELSALSRRMWSVQEEERRRIARELHDEAGQAMTALKLNLDLARKETDPERVRPRVVDAAELASDVLEELRRIARDLRPASLDDLGLVPALRGLLDGFGQRTLLEASFESEGQVPNFDADSAAATYRFVQEALSNVGRHARARWVRVRLESDDRSLRVTVEDDGCGFDAELATQQGSLGLLGLRERARVLGGRVTLDSRRGNGARVCLELPAPRPRAENAVARNDSGGRSPGEDDRKPPGESATAGQDRPGGSAAPRGEER